MSIGPQYELLLKEKAEIQINLQSLQRTAEEQKREMKELHETNLKLEIQLSSKL